MAVLMLLSVFGESLDIATLEAEVFASDAALEFLGSIGLAHWNLIELVMAGVALVLLPAALLTTGCLVPKSMRSADGRPPDKIPI
ncbi:MAG: hypothetical protein KIT36_07815 [Alphaproteobacteria bacterium]|nr:hypothetical protein [Alphaproteobacteria bacterium]